MFKKVLIILFIGLLMQGCCNMNIICNSKSDELKAGDARIFDGIEFVYIPSGEFNMGCKSDKEPETCPEIEGSMTRGPDEKPVHRVEITKGFWMSKYEITQAQWTRVMGYNMSDNKGDDHPVEMVSWSNVMDFIDQMNTDGKGKYRLPTEAEWEYACRAGSTSEYYFGDDESMLVEYAWFLDNSDGKTHPVGQKKPNPWGLYDMYGNVYEWCSDWYDEKYYSKSPTKDPKGPSDGKHKVIRGGAYSTCFTASFCTSSNRETWYVSKYPSKPFQDMGIRLVREK